VSIQSGAPSSEFVRRKIGGLHWTIRAPGIAPALLEVLRDPESALGRATLVFKDSRVVSVVRLPPVAPGQPNLVLRCLKYGKKQHRVRDIFRPSRTERALLTGHQLEQAGLPTPRALAAATRRRWRWPLRAYLITEEVPGALTLPDLFLRDLFFPRVVAGRLGRALGRLHQAGFSHADLKATNLLVDDQLQPQFIDLDGVRRQGAIPDAQAVAELSLPASYARPVLRASRGACVLFLKEYCAARGREDWRWWWRALARASAR
jgi:hypothetical protein